MAKKKRKNDSALLIVLVLLAAFTVITYITVSFGGLGSSIYKNNSFSIADDQIPAEFIPIYKAAEEEFEVDWKLLAAIHKKETKFSTMDTLVSPVGAEGHLQFMPCTWTGWSHPSCSGLGDGSIEEETKISPDAISRYGGYGIDANGDGIADPYDIEDAVFSAANYLEQNGAGRGHIQSAVYAYNRANWYVDDVIELYEGYQEGYQEIEVDESHMIAVSIKTFIK
ncbi:lytic transglycosylase domain-containing protein [Halalkalibacillus halophilus]|uniref:lytic transglycosylase domain-containing protein n=1 Tax=Halalkalibacillus halophilus TaxID=392827 RepID=UPI0004111584|nr:lytic transglycosylase domain-containing protein [Halalkalibacillus halophilus]